MRRGQSFLFPLVSILLFLSTLSQAQLWSGVLASSRAIDWSNAGIPGGLPDASWTKCGSTIAPYGSSGSPASPATINNQIATCSTNQYVQLGAGTFYLNAGITLQGHNQVVLRGMGANSTFIVFTGETGCNGQYSEFCLAGSNSGGIPSDQAANWTAGFAQGATQITLSNSLGIVAGSTLINLDQQDEASDTGSIWNCQLGACGSFGGGGSRNILTCASSVSPFVGVCSQQQEVLAVSCSPSCNRSGSTVVTITPGLYMPNWRSSQSTGAFWANTTAYRMGVEDLSADLTNTTAGTQTVVIMNCYECFVSGIRSIDAARNHIFLWEAAHSLIQFNYLFQSTSHSSESYGIELYVADSDNLVLGNICQQITDGCPNNTAGGAGNVAAYNFSVDDIFGTGWFQPSDYDHAAGEDFWLREGESALGVVSDLVHGTHHFTTVFRSNARGWASSGCGGAGPNQCYGNTTPLNFWGGSRYFNVVGNVLGQATYGINGVLQSGNYDTVYNTLGTNGSLSGGSNQNLSVYYLGGANGQAGNATFCANPACTSTRTDADVLGINSIMRWGNWDVVTKAVRWCTANATPIAACTGDERGGTFGDTTGTPSTYAGLSSPSQTLPNSFFMSGVTSTTSSSPCGTGLSWWKNPTRGTCEPFPPAGPDVSNGDYGNCASGVYVGNVCRVGSNQCGAGIACNQAMGGHANLNPAHSCFLDVMGGPPDGTGSVLPYNRTSCYANDPSSSDPPPAPPTGLSAVVQ